VQVGNPCDEDFIVVDKRDKQAIQKTILALEQELSLEERHALYSIRQQSLINTILNLEKEYSKFDFTLEQATERFNDLISLLRNALTAQSLLQAKNALYEATLSQNQINNLMTHEQFAQWRQEFQKEVV
jgi:hypothetical protein